MANTVQFTVNAVCKDPPPGPRFRLLTSTDNPSNFPTAHRAPQLHDPIVFTPRASDTTQNGGMALMAGNDFLGWVRHWDIARITTRMAQIIPVQGQIAGISRTYTWRGVTCMEFQVDVF